MQPIKCFFWYVVLLVELIFWELAFVFLAPIFLTHILLLIIFMSGVLGKNARNITERLAKKTRRLNFSKIETRKIVNEIIDWFVERGLLNKGIKTIIANNSLTEDDMRLIGVSIIGSIVFSIVASGSVITFVVLKVSKVTFGN